MKFQQFKYDKCQALSKKSAKPLKRRIEQI